MLSQKHNYLEQNEIAFGFLVSTLWENSHALKHVQLIISYKLICRADLLCWELSDFIGHYILLHLSPCLDRSGI